MFRVSIKLEQLGTRPTYRQRQPTTEEVPEPVLSFSARTSDPVHALDKVIRILQGERADILAKRPQPIKSDEDIDDDEEDED